MTQLEKTRSTFTTHLALALADITAHNEALWREFIAATRHDLDRLEAKCNKEQIIVWTEPGGCMHCKHCAYSPYDEPVCYHPNTLAQWDGSVNINAALKQCQHTWWEPRHDK